jgi:hypothetical protein
MVRAKEHNCGLTQAVEQGLWRWVQEKRPTDPVSLQVRLVAQSLSQALNNATLPFWAWMSAQRPHLCGHSMTVILDWYREDPAS